MIRVLRRSGGGLATAPRPAPSPAADSAGYSLIELLVAFGLIGVVYAAMATLMVKTHESYESTGLTRDLRQQARVATNRLVFELRYAGYGLENVPRAFWLATPTTVSFAADVDRGDPRPPCTDEGGPDAGVELISYRFADSSLSRRVDCWSGGSWALETAFTPVAENITIGEQMIRYFDADGVELVPGGGGLTESDRARVALIRLAVSMVDAAGQIEGEPAPEFRYSTDVLIRNSPELLARMSGVQ